jgi:hypothetical protein
MMQQEKLPGLQRILQFEPIFGPLGMLDLKGLKWWTSNTVWVQCKQWTFVNLPEQIGAKALVPSFKTFAYVSSYSMKRALLHGGKTTNIACIGHESHLAGTY